MAASNAWYVYTTPTGATVTMQPDSDHAYTAQQSNDTDRQDEQKIQFPETLARQGAQLTVSAPDYQEFTGRGLLQPKQVCPNCGAIVAEEAFFGFNDIHLGKKEVAPPTPQPPASNDPLDIINAVYATGAYNLATKQGCGQFTEECCRQLHERNSPTWGHIKKTGAQNQWNAHAVDALSCLGGEEYGVWDIIFSSASSNARPVYNRAGDPKPEEWRPPEPLPCQ